MKIQNAYGTKTRREKELAKTNREMSKHFEDTYDTENVLLNGNPFNLMIIKDTDGNVFKKKIKSRHEDKFNLGDYIIWNHQVWLVTLLDPDSKTWNRGYMYLCTVPLRWQNSKGEIIERYAYSEDFTKYSSGITGNDTIAIGDNQYGLTLPIDNETKKLKRDMRFCIDFEDIDAPDVYKLSNRKVCLNDNSYFDRGGTMILTVSYDTFNINTDKRITIDNGQEVWICDYKDIRASSLHQTLIPDASTTLNATILGNSALKVGLSRTYTVNFTDKNGDYVDWHNVNFNWNITSDFDSALIQQTIDGNTINLSIKDENLVGDSFILSIISNSIEFTQFEVTIMNIV